MTEAEANAATAELPDCDLDSRDAAQRAETPLSGAEIAALKLADLLTEPTTVRVDQALMSELSEHFEPGQILELASALSVASGWQRFIEAFGIRPDHWTEATPLPPRPERGR